MAKNKLAVILKVTGEVVNTMPKNGKDFKFEELQKIVGGYIEIVNLDDNHIMVVNEEGKLMDLPYNQKATYLYQNRFIGCSDYIVGNVLVCETSMIK